MARRSGITPTTLLRRLADAIDAGTIKADSWNLEILPYLRDGANGMPFELRVKGEVDVNTATVLLSERDIT